MALYLQVYLICYMLYLQDDILQVLDMEVFFIYTTTYLWLFYIFE